MISKNSTLADFKLKVAELLNLPNDQFLLKRNGVNRELKDSKRTLLQLGLNSGALIKVELGTPHNEGVFDLKVLVANLVSEPDNVLF